MDSPANKKFVSEYEAAYKAVPASYAMQAYDAAMLINSAVVAVKGNLADQNAVRAALKKARLPRCADHSSSTSMATRLRTFTSPRSPSAADGKYETQIVEKIFSNHADGYAKDCNIR
jgi:branched-chain amino acid transport system substrate-binding protein